MPTVNAAPACSAIAESMTMHHEADCTGQSCIGSTLSSCIVATHKIIDTAPHLDLAV